jgi:hypothetical protein
MTDDQKEKTLAFLQDNWERSRRQKIENLRMEIAHLEEAEDISCSDWHYPIELGDLEIWHSEQGTWALSKKDSFTAYNFSLEDVRASLVKRGLL